MGPFEEEEEGTGVASDVVKVQGEDPATPGPLKRNDPETVTTPQYRVNKTKQHTGTHQALPGFLITAPPSVCVPAVLGALAVWIQNHEKKNQ